MKRIIISLMVFLVIFMIAGAHKFPQLTDKQGTFRILGRTDYTATVDFIKINY